MSEDDLASIKADLALFAGDGTGDTLTPDEVKAIFTMETGDGTPFSEDELAKFTSVILAKCPVDADGKVSIADLAAQYVKPPPAAEPAAAETAAETAAAEPTDAEPADAEPDAGAGPAADGAEPTGELVAVDAPMDTETGAASAPAAEAEEGSAVQARDSGAAPPVSTQTVAENSTEIDATEPMVEG